MPPPGTLLPTSGPPGLDNAEGRYALLRVHRFLLVRSLAATGETGPGLYLEIATMGFALFASTLKASVLF
jgi:hypothetical protein